VTDSRVLFVSLILEFVSLFVRRRQEWIAFERTMRGSLRYRALGQELSSLECSWFKPY
jgi:hypothetical protein